MEKMLISSEGTAASNVRNNGVKGKEARRLQLSSYFAPFRGTSSVKHSEGEKWKNMSQVLEIMRPVRTSLQSLQFCVLHEHLTLPSSVLRAFDVSLVGLCVCGSSDESDEKQKSEGIRIVRCVIDISPCKKIIQHSNKQVRNHMNVTKCVGLGIVRSINVEKNELLLVTPVPLSLIQDVTLLYSDRCPCLIVSRKSLEFSITTPYVQVFDKSDLRNKCDAESKGS